MVMKHPRLRSKFFMPYYHGNKARRGGGGGSTQGNENAQRGTLLQVEARHGMVMCHFHAYNRFSRPPSNGM